MVTLKFFNSWLFQEGMLSAQSERLSEQARFIMMKIGNQIQIENKRKAAIIDQLIEKKFKPDPVKIWKEEQKKKELEKGEAANDEEEDEVEVGCLQTMCLNVYFLTRY